ncbi:cGMP-dependent protein kinase 1-like isoform X4 [Convolutriloba macropyga]|uniref:cGMP-dependent protein kinase 1-like isoform X4 n=1 Tax=Convolutriloba macropyga TaxID=536237 RepID=UPI003F51EB2C
MRKSIERNQSEEPRSVAFTPETRRANFGAKMWASTTHDQRNTSFRVNRPTSWQSSTPSHYTHIHPVKRAPSPPSSKESAESNHNDFPNGFFGVATNSVGSMSTSRSDYDSAAAGASGTFRNPISRLSSTIRSVNFVSFLGGTRIGSDSEKEFIEVDGQQMDVEEIRNLIPFLRKENLDKHQAMKNLEKENQALRRQLKEKDDEIAHLQEEMDKMRSVLQQMQMGTANHSSAFNSLSANQSLADGGESGGGGGGLNASVNVKKQGVSAESAAKPTNHVSIQVKKYPKSKEVKELIQNAIERNEFTQHLEQSQMSEIVECMHEVKFNADDYVIKEGDQGDCLYVIQDGVLEVSKKGKTLTRLNSGTLFGELAILYNCTRTASVKALTYSRIWKIERQSFQKIMMKVVLSEEDEILSFLQSVPLLKELPIEMMNKLVYCVDFCHFSPDEYIIRENAYGETFYIIRQGKVRVVQNHPQSGLPVLIRHLQKGDYFGEKALICEDRRTASIITDTEVECVQIDRSNFIELIGPLEEIKNKKYSDTHKTDAATREDVAFPEEFQHVKISDLYHLGTIGQGGFGRVDLVKHIGRDGKASSYALKCLRKQHIVELKQQDHIYSEKAILLSSDCPFIIKLFRTFKDRKFVYMLMEVCLGGELWTHMNHRLYLSDSCAKFSVACVVLAFEYLHGRGIIYRDLKPENLLLTSNGYVKMCDFGFAKKIGRESKTWTFCGTPEYTAPEIILNKGHDFAADYWAIGILVYELLNGIPPFTGGDAMKTYSMILKGVDMLDLPTKRMHKNSVNFMKKCCKINPSERLGYQKNGITDIKKHKWFDSFDWTGLQNCTLHSPFKIKVKNALDSSNFDFLQIDQDLAEDELSGWDDHF